MDRGVMSKLFEFTKIEATGNDFIVIDLRKYSANYFSAEVIKKMCERHFGIGADGVILINGHPEHAFKMRYFNSDGLEAAMCANGGRCAVLFAAVSGITKCEEDITFEAADGLHHAKIHSSDSVEIELLYHSVNIEFKISDLQLPENMEVEGFIDTGVPHLVVNCQDDLDKIDVNSLGRRLRFDPCFGENGINVNFINIDSTNEITIRSYERGIEGETLSCGTGIAASALLCIQNKLITSHNIRVNSNGGELFVTLSKEKLFLRGAVNIVYVGNLHLD